MNKQFKPKISKLFVFTVAVFTAVTGMMVYAYIRTGIPLLMIMIVLFLMIDAFYLFPNIFYTRYIFEEQYLVVREWPFRYTKVFYEDVVSFDDASKGDRIRKAALSFNSVTIGYYDDEDYKNYVEVAPKDIEMFMLVLSSRVKNFSNAEKLRIERIARQKDEKRARRKKYLDLEEEKKRIKDSETVTLKVSGVKKEHGVFKVIDE